jgi:ABC-type transporter Mla MlaB component
MAARHVLKLDDAVVGAVPESLTEVLDCMLELGPDVVVVDLSDVSTPSSTTIAALLRIRRRCTDRGIAVELRGTSRRTLGELRRVGIPVAEQG